MRRVTWIALGGALLGAAACADDSFIDDGDVGIVGNSKAVPVGSASPQQAEPTDPAMIAKPDGPLLGATDMALSIYHKPDHRSPKVGYLRVGTMVHRAEKPAAFDSCQGGFYNIVPRGYVCVDDGGTIDMEHPLLKANLGQADHTKPLPYDYAFVRAIAPRYYRLPTEKEQFQYEMSLERHLRSFKRLKHKWNAHDVGANDVPIDSEGLALGPPPLEPPDLNYDERFGGSDGTIPWFFDGGRKIPNISTFKVPKYAVITNRIKRHAGVALIDAFQGDGRHFGLTTDLRLVPTSKLKPGRGSTFHGVELVTEWELPVAFVRKKASRDYVRKKGRFRRRKKRYAYGTPIQLTGESKKYGGTRFVETEAGHWMRDKDLAIVAKLSKLPKISKKDQKWIDVSILRQTLILYQGSTPLYATMVSTGKDGLGDPGKTHSTPRGTFRVREKHITATMDSQTLGSEFELNDVPWVQYFKAGYALHAAYWHTEYGRARSHGCINLSPIDAFHIFGWTEPQLPHKWHGVAASEEAGKGTLIHIHP